MLEFIHNTFTEANEMTSIAISPFEAEVLSRYWLSLVNAHNHERVDLNTHSSCALRQDHYALERCEAYIAAGLLTESDFLATRDRVFDKYTPEDEESDSSSGDSIWARIKSE